MQEQVGGVEGESSVEGERACQPLQAPALLPSEMRGTCDMVDMCISVWVRKMGRKRGEGRRQDGNRRSRTPRTIRPNFTFLHTHSHKTFVGLKDSAAEDMTLDLLEVGQSLARRLLCRVHERRNDVTRRKASQVGKAIVQRQSLRIFPPAVWSCS